jgi:putative ABC transport system substrate-binding protein
MRRRDFIKVIAGSTAAWPFAAHAQQSGRVRRVGLLTPLAESDAEGQARLRALRQGLETLGWIEGRNLEVDYQWANDADHSGAAAAKLVEHAPDVIVVNGIVMLTALKRATQSVPIVFVQVPDPVRDGFVASLAHPGGNITGFTNFEYALGGKWLDLLREIAPELARVAIIQNPGDQDSSEYLGAVKAAARRIGLQAISDDARDDADIERIIGALAKQPNSGLIVLPGAFTFVHLKAIVASVVRHRLPAVYPYRYFIAGGGLMSYGIETVDLYSRAASYVDRILKGEKPADLPVQAPTKYQLVINLKAAKVIGLTVPSAMLVRADEVVE